MTTPRFLLYNIIFLLFLGNEDANDIGSLLSNLLKEKNIPTMTYHLDLWFGLERQTDLNRDNFYKTIGHFFTVDKLMADWFNENTDVKGHFLPAGVYDQECYVHDDYDFDNFENDVIFVGSKRYHHEYQYRPQLIDFLRNIFLTHDPNLRSVCSVIRNRISSNFLFVHCQSVGDIFDT